MSFEPLFKEYREFELRRAGGSRFHSLGAKIWNARDIVLYRGSGNRRVPDDRRQRGGCKNEVFPRPGYIPFRLYNTQLHDSLPDFPVTPIPPPTSRNMSIGFQSLFALNIKIYLLLLRPKWGWHLNISVTPFDFPPLPHPFVLYASWTGGSSLSLGPGQPSLESPSTFSAFFSLIIQSFYVLRPITS